MCPICSLSVSFVLCCKQGCVSIHSFPGKKNPVNDVQARRQDTFCRKCQSVVPSSRPEIGAHPFPE